MGRKRCVFCERTQEVKENGERSKLYELEQNTIHTRNNRTIMIPGPESKYDRTLIPFIDSETRLEIKKEIKENSRVCDDCIEKLLKSDKAKFSDDMGDGLPPDFFTCDNCVTYTRSTPNTAVLVRNNMGLKTNRKEIILCVDSESEFYYWSKEFDIPQWLEHNEVNYLCEKCLKNWLDTKKIQKE